jgi:AcrR family transcriptional regulator
MVRSMTRKKRPARRDAGRPRGAPIAEAVLARTLEELAAVGLEGLSIERIAKAAEVNKTSIYRRWPTREALVAAALEGIAADVGSQLADTGSLRGDLLHLATQVAAHVSRPEGRALLRAAFAESAEESVAELAAQQLAGRGGPLRTLVVRARARGEWRSGVSGQQLVSMLVGAILHRVLLEHAAVSKRWLEGLVDLALLGALPR